MPPQRSKTVIHATVEELSEAVLSVQSALVAACLCNIADARKYVFCFVLPEAIS
jgi:hypothetical protein